MNKAGRILSINPPYALPGGEVLVECENFEINRNGDFGCFFDGQKARLIGASSKRILAIVPDDFDTTEVEVHLESGGERSESAAITIAKRLAEDLHIVSNPAVDPTDDSIILTRSGSRGQQLPVTLFRLEPDGYLQEMMADMMNPTGAAFDPKGQLFVTNRASGEVCRINHDTEVVPVSSELGIATGIAFDKNGVMYVGDRSGTVYQVTDFGDSKPFAILEPSVSAYHMAFDPEGNLCVSAPGLSSFDSVYSFDESGYENDEFYRGLGRPQGLAFDREGNLYIAACLHARRGIVKILTDKEAELFVAGMNVIGLCFNRKGEMIIATSDSVYSLPLEIYGTILN
ncbi:MAG: gluconolaconase [Pyrinomonadaceae bacterium]